MEHKDDADDLHEDHHDAIGLARVCHHQEDAENVVSMIESKFTKMAEPMEIQWVGSTIGAHTGPGMISICYFGDKDHMLDN